jgi:hypothetical protein
MQDSPEGFTLTGRRENGEEVVKVQWYGDEYYLTIPLHMIRLDTEGLYWLRDQGFPVCTAALQAWGLLDELPSKFPWDMPKELEAPLFVFYDKARGKYFHKLWLPISRLRWVSYFLGITLYV